MQFRFRSMKVLLFLILSTLLPSSGIVPQPATVYAAEKTQSALAASPSEIAASVINFTLVDGGLFYATEPFELCPVELMPPDEASVAVASTEVVSSAPPTESVAAGEMVDFLARHQFANAGARRLYERVLPHHCNVGSQTFLSELAIDQDYVYWVNEAGLVRLHRDSNLGDQPQVIVAGLQSSTLRNHGDYLVVDLADGIHRIEKSTGNLLQLVWGTTNNVTVDNDGIIYYTDGNAALRYVPIGGGTTQQLAANVSAYYAEGVRTICDPDCATSQRTTHYVYYARGKDLFRVDFPSTVATNIYTSSFQTDHEISIDAITSGASEKETPTLYFWEERKPPCPNPIACPDSTRVLVRLSEEPTVESPAVIYERKISTNFARNEVLAATGEHVYWRENRVFGQIYEGRLLRLPRTASAIPQVDLKINGIELTQGLQDVNNTIPLIQKRRTFVRVYVSADGTDEAHGITAELSAIGQNGVLQPINGKYGGTPTTQITVKRLPASRDTLNDAFLFELPWEWTTMNLLRLTVKLDPGNVMPEYSEGDNVVTKDFTFKPAGIMRLNVFPYEYSIQGAVFSPTQAEIDAFNTVVRQMFPVANFGGANVTQGFVPAYHPLKVVNELASRIDQSHEDCEELDAEDRNLCATKYIQARLLGSVDTWGSDNAPHLGIYANHPTFKPRSSAKVAEQVAASTTNDAMTAMAHEYAHMLGLRHPFLGSTEDPDASGVCVQDPGSGLLAPSTAFDNADSRIGPQGGTIQGLQFDPNALAPVIRLITSTTTYDFMAYCSPNWISDDYYNALYFHQGLPHPPAPPADDKPPINKPQPGDWFEIRGTLVAHHAAEAQRQANPTGEVVYTNAMLHVTQRVSSAVATQPQEGSYSVQLLRGNNIVLADYPFTPEYDEDSTSLADFAMVVPWVTGTTQIRVVRLGNEASSAPQLIRQLAVSLTPPVVSNLAIQNPTSPVSGTVTLSWQASDADNNPLTFDIFYSRNGGESFQALIYDAKGNSTTLDSNLIGGGAVIFRVLAKDGLQTNVTDSPVYILADKAPRTRILHAQRPIRLLYGQNVNLDGEALDVQDHYVAEDSMVWTNQLGIELGRGSVLSLVDLPAGTTRITLTATNSRGLSSSDFIDLVVKDVLAPLGPTLAVGPSSVNWSVIPGAGLQQTTLSVNNLGSSGMEWVAEESADWLTLNVSQGSDSAQITLNADPAGIPHGTTRSATIRFRTTNLSPEQSVIIQVGMAVGQMDALVVGDGTPASCTAAALTSVLQSIQSAQGGRVRFNCGVQPHTIELPSTLIIQVPVVIEGDRLITLRGMAGRIFQVCIPAEQGAKDIELQLYGLTLTGGNSNSNQAGGAITNYGCRVTVTDTAFIGNRAINEAGAINSVFGGTLIVENSLFADNSANTIGGAIVLHDGELIVRNSTFRNNQSKAGNGGAIFAYDAAAVTIEASSFISNHASTRGGAISLAGVTTPSKVINSTFVQNTSVLGGGAIRSHHSNGMIELFNVTVVGEQGLSLSGNITIRNSLVSNRAGAENCEGAIAAVGPNLEYPGTSCHASINGQAPQLAPLAEYPGLTSVIPLTADSPARDAGDNNICASAPVNGVDQRGGQRPLPLGGRCDLGALEFNPTQIQLAATVNFEATPLELQQFNQELKLPMITK